jgi:ribosomal protein S18 acetylase RimI-like enzyme
MNSGSTTIPLHIHPLVPADLPELLRIQAACYGAGYLEGADRFAARLAVAPHTCWLARGADGFARAYLVACPTLRGAITPLNAVFEPAAQPDTLYLHDLAVDPEARGSGAADALVQAFLSALARLPLPRASLIAIQGSAPWWARHGFARVPVDGALGARLAGYGEDAAYMVRLTG